LNVITSSSLEKQVFLGVPMMKPGRLERVPLIRLRREAGQLPPEIMRQMSALAALGRVKASFRACLVLDVLK
jgi:hypothetical protein